MAKRKKKKKAKRSEKQRPRSVKKTKRKVRAEIPAGQKKLTEKQRRFVEAYMGQAVGNATEAARLAGYKGNRITLESTGRENLGKPRIREAINERAEADPAVATRKERQQFWRMLLELAGETTEEVDPEAIAQAARVEVVRKLTTGLLEMASGMGQLEGEKRARLARGEDRVQEP